MQNYVITRFVKAPFTSDGDTDGVGVITVSTDNAKLLWPGARVIVKSSDAEAVEALILEDLGGGKLRVRLDDASVGTLQGATDKAFSPRAVPAPKGGSSWSAYHLADAAYIMQPADQYIFPYTRDGVVPRTPSALAG